jgi:hypothetical protein
MCYEFERDYWLRRAEEACREMHETEERMRQPKPATPARPAAPDIGAEQREPVPA